MSYVSEHFRSARLENTPFGLTFRRGFDILSVREFADISISVCEYEYLFSKRKGFGGKS
jgi:hypothetical protein